METEFMFNNTKNHIYGIILKCLREKYFKLCKINLPKVYWTLIYYKGFELKTNLLCDSVWKLFRINKSIKIKIT